MKTLKFYYEDCLKNHYAIGAYNFNDLQTLFGICEGCKKTNSPAILALSENGLQFMHADVAIAVFNAVKKEYNLPLFLHLDHGHSFEICKMAVDLGFDSVMFDGSSLPFEENVKVTKQVVEYAHKRGVLVEAELGVLAGIEEKVSSTHNIFTNPQQAKEFVQKTGCDSLAVAVGTSHGAYKYNGTPLIRFDILSEIEKEIPSTPLVLHGASSVPQKYIDIINKNGGNIVGASGTSNQILFEASTNHNIFKINTDTDIRLCYMATTRKNLNENRTNFDMRKCAQEAISEISNLIAEKNKNFNSVDKA